MNALFEDESSLLLIITTIIIIIKNTINHFSSILSPLLWFDLDISSSLQLEINSKIRTPRENCATTRKIWPNDGRGGNDERCKRNKYIHITILKCAKMLERRVNRFFQRDESAWYLSLPSKSPEIVKPSRTHTLPPS